MAKHSQSQQKQLYIATEGEILDFLPIYLLFLHCDALLSHSSWHFLSILRIPSTRRNGYAMGRAWMMIRTVRWWKTLKECSLVLTIAMPAISQISLLG